MESATKLIKEYEEEEIASTFSKIQAYLKDNNISNGKITVKSLYKCDKESIPTKEKIVKCTIKLPAEKKDQADQLREDLREDHAFGENIEIVCGVGIGDQFVPIEDVRRPEVIKEEENSFSFSSIFSFCTSRGEKQRRKESNYFSHQRHSLTCGFLGYMVRTLPETNGA